MRVKLAEHLADDRRRLAELGVGVEVQVGVHRVQDSPLDGLQAVAHVRQRAGRDDADGVVEVTPLRLGQPARRRPAEVGSSPPPFAAPPPRRPRPPPAPLGLPWCRKIQLSGGHRAKVSWTLKDQDPICKKSPVLPRRFRRNMTMPWCWPGARSPPRAAAPRRARPSPPAPALRDAAATPSPRTSPPSSTAGASPATATKETRGRPAPRQLRGRPQGRRRRPGDRPRRPAGQPAPGPNRTPHPPADAAQEAPPPRPRRHHPRLDRHRRPAVAVDPHRQAVRRPPGPRFTRGCP